MSRIRKQPIKTLTGARKSGFTMVEVMLAIACISILLIAVVILINSLISIYRKGTTVKAVNNVGRSLVENFTSAINVAPPVDTIDLCEGYATNNLVDCRASRAYKFIFQANYDADGHQQNGIFCTGNYSYVWNTYYGLKEGDGSTLSLIYLDTSNEEKKIPGNQLRLVRVQDPSYRVCTSVVDKNYNSTLTPSTAIDITKVATGGGTGNLIDNPIPNPETGILNSFEADLAFGEFTIFPISQDAVTLRTFMSGTFILTTVRGDVDTMASGDYCQAGINKFHGNEGDSGSIFDLGAEFNYCAINKFNFAARTAGL